MITHRSPHKSTAFTFRVLKFIEYASRNENLSIILVSFHENIHSEELYFNYCKNIVLEDMPSFKSRGILIYFLSNYLKGIFTFKNRNLLNFSFSCEMYNKIKKIIQENDIDIIYVDSPTMAYYVYNIKIPKLVEILDSANITHDAYKREKRIPNRLLKYFIYIMHKNTTKLYDKFDACITVTEEEKEKLQSYSHNANILVCPFGADIISEYDNIVEVYPSILFLGNMGSPFNQESALYIYNKIFPNLKRAFPSLKFFIVGKDPSKELLNISIDESVVITGYVDDIHPYIAKASVIVLPIHGYGIKTRILEIMGMGKAIVTSPESIKWLRAESGKDIVTASNSNEYIYEISRLLEDGNLRKEIGYNARCLVTKTYSWDSISNWLENLMAYYSNKP